MFIDHVWIKLDDNNASINKLCEHTITIQSNYGQTDHELVAQNPHI